MAFKVFLDINIFMDVLDTDRKNHKDAVALFEEAEAGNVLAYVTESVLNTTAYLIRKDYQSTQLISLLNHFLSFVELIPVNTVIYLAGLQRTVNDVEDAVLYSAALNAHLDFFLTNDLKDFRKLEVAALPVMQVKDALAYFNK